MANLRLWHLLGWPSLYMIWIMICARCAMVHERVIQFFITRITRITLTYVSPVSPITLWTLGKV